MVQRRFFLFLLWCPAAFLIACSARQTATEVAPAPIAAAAPAAVCDGPFDAEYAWSLFEALNAPLATPGTKMWETDFRQTSTIYLPDGSRPAAWGSEPSPTAPYPTAADCSAASTVWHNLDTAIQVDGLALLDTWGNDVRYQLLMNQPAFDYILGRELYNVNGQELLAQAGEPAVFPQEAFELKTSWIWIGTDESKCEALADKYYLVNAYYVPVDNDGQPLEPVYGFAALTGMHIINRCLPDWVWITFENVHNADFTQVSLELPISSAVQAANTQHQQALQAAGSIFANYQLDGVQTTFTEPTDPSTATLLANSNIESAFQTQSSCITCHSLASIKPDGEYFNMVDTSGGNVSYYVGEPPDIEAKGFTSLDFVWSLKRAHRERVPATDSE